MDQLVVLHEIFESFANGSGSLQRVDPGSITGSCAGQVAGLLSSAQSGEIDAAICQQLSDCFTDIYELKRLGDICRRAGLYDLAIKCYNKAISSSSDVHVRAVLMNNLGQVYARQGDLGKAVLYYRKAAEGFEASKDGSGVAHVLGNLGSAYRRGYQWDMAIDYCFKSLRSFESENDPFGVAQMTGSLGRVYAEMGELDLAIRYFEKSHRDFERLGDKRNAAWLLNRLGKNYAKRWDYEKSESCFKKGLSIFDELGQPHNSGIVLSNLARMQLDRGDFSASREFSEKASKLIRRDMMPAYQNTISIVAAAYSLEGRKDLHQALMDSSSKKETEAVAYARRASAAYSRASDRLHELSTLPKVSLSELKVASSIARSISYTAALAASKEEEAIALAERAISALDAAMASSAGSEKAEIMACSRCLLGMKEAMALDVSRNEPWKLMKMVASSAEYLAGAAKELIESSQSSKKGSIDPLRNIADSLKSIGAAIEADRQRQDSASALSSAVSGLTAAKRIFEQSKSDIAVESAALMAHAVSTLEALIGVSSSGRRSGIDPSQLVNYSGHKKALLAIGWCIAANGYSQIDKSDWIYVWDDSMNLSELGPAGKPAERQKINRSTQKVDLPMDVYTPHIGSAAGFASANDQRLQAASSLVSRSDFSADGRAAASAGYGGGVQLSLVPSSFGLAASSSRMSQAEDEASTWGGERSAIGARAGDFGQLAIGEGESESIEDASHSTAGTSRRSRLEEPEVVLEREWSPSSASDSGPKQGTDDGEREVFHRPKKAKKNGFMDFIRPITMGAVKLILAVTALILATFGVLRLM